MQDRFKFRIWDKFCETWLTDFAINQDGEINKFFNSEEALKRRFVLMQSTGLKDKNGKLIYEGDILNYACLAGYSDIYTCTFNNGSFLIGGLLVSNTHLKSEVIGNIYENPELLEV